MGELVKDKDTKVTIDGVLTDTVRKRLKERLQHACVIAVLFLFPAVVMVNNYSSNCHVDPFETYGYYTAVMLYVISLSPCLSIPACIASFLGFIMYNPYETNRRPDISISNIPFICFRVVTRGDFPTLIAANVKTNKSLCQSVGLQNFMIEIVSDKPIHFPKNDEFVREVVVPDTYTTEKKTLFKARALNYCLETHINLCAQNDWIVHLDEETLLSEQALYGIINFVTSGKADIGQGPISYANGDVIQNWITTLSDSIRLAFDYSLFRFSFAYLHAPPFGFKGSYVVIRNSVETEVGLDFGPRGSVAEDCFFALLAWSKGYTFDFILGEMKEKSPFTIMDFIKQRKRWFVGQSYVFLSKDIPFYNKAVLGLSLTASILMPSSFLSLVISLSVTFCKPPLLGIIISFIGGTFGFLYAFGAFLSLSRRNWAFWPKCLVSLFNCLFLVLVAFSLEVVAVWWGLLSVMLNVTEFTVVKKEVPTERTKWCNWRLPMSTSLRVLGIRKKVKNMMISMTPSR